MRAQQGFEDLLTHQWQGFSTELVTDGGEVIGVKVQFEQRGGTFSFSDIHLMMEMMKLALYAAARG